MFWIFSNFLLILSVFTCFFRRFGQQVLKKNWKITQKMSCGEIYCGLNHVGIPSSIMSFKYAWVSSGHSAKARAVCSAANTKRYEAAFKHFSQNIGARFQENNSDLIFPFVTRTKIYIYHPMSFKHIKILCLWFHSSFDWRFHVWIDSIGCFLIQNVSEQIEASWLAHASQVASF